MSTVGERKHQVNFSSWLQTVCQEYVGLGDAERNEVLEHLINLSGNQQLRFLGNLLPLLLYRDFFSLLPAEICLCILKYLDTKSVLNCCRVSKAWNKVINNLTDIWIGLIEENGGGALNSLCHPSKPFKTTFLQLYQKIREMENESAFEKIYLTGHQSRVMAVHYHEGIIATGSDDRSIKIWNARNGECCLAIRTPSVSDIKFDDTLLFVASYDNSVICYDFGTGREKCRYVGHVSAVLSIDFNIALNLLLTGSADRSVKIWHIESGQLLNSIVDIHSNWVLQVKFVKLENENSDIYGDDILSSERTTFLSSCKEKSLLWLVDRSGAVLTGKQINKTKEFLPTQTGVPILSSQNTFYFLWADEEGQQFITEKKCSMKEEPGDNIVLTVSSCSCRALPDDLPTGSVFVGCGEKFAVFIAQELSEALVIVNRVSREIVTYMPFQSCRPTMNGASISLGESRWLDGITGDSLSGLILATCLKNNSVLLLKWKTDPESGTFPNL
ncbi:hypothetical protein ScPMuIL_017956 [Solemya velum]